MPDVSFNWSKKSDARRGDPVRLAVIHTAEGARTNGSLEAWFMRDDVQASSHAGGDDDGRLEMVPYSRAAWTIRRANSISDNLELCGFASWSREEWLRHDGMLNVAAEWIAERCRARGNPIVKLTPAQVAAGQSGACGHVDWTMATRLQGNQDGTHTDPGPNFPWDIVMSRANGNSINQEEDDMTPDQATQLAKIYDTLPSLANGAFAAGNNSEAINEIRGNVQNINNGVLALIGRDPSAISAADLAAALPDALAQQVADVLAKRLAK